MWYVNILIDNVLLHKMAIDAAGSCLIKKKINNNNNLRCL